MSNLTLLAPALEEARVRLRVVVSQTTSATLAAADSGKAISNAGATASITYTLPSAVAGRLYEIRNATDAYTLTVAPNGSDRIGLAIAGAPTVLPPRTILVLECQSSGRWTITTDTRIGTEIDVRDYGAVGDGVTNDAPAIAAAISSMSSGDTLLFPGGMNYAIGSSGWTGLSISGLNDITIDARGAQITLLSQPSQSVPTVSAKVAIKVTNCNRVRLLGGVYDGGNINAIFLNVGSCVDPEILHWRCKNVGLAGTPVSSGVIKTNGNTRPVIAWNVIGATAAGSTIRGIWCGDSNSGQNDADARIIGNTVSGTNYTGIVVFSAGAVVSQNYVENTGMSGIISPTSAAESAKDHVITENRIHNCSAYGYQTDVITTKLQNLTLHNNIITDCGLGGVYINDCEHFSVSGNQLLRNGDDGNTERFNARIEDSARGSFTNNRLLGIATGHGLRINGESSTQTDIIISGNVITGSSGGRGIDMEQNQPADALRRITVSRNVVTDCSYGVYVRQSHASAVLSDLVFDSNFVQGNSNVDWFFRQDNISGGNPVNGLRMINNVGVVDWDGNGTPINEVLPSVNIGNEWTLAESVKTTNSTLTSAEFGRTVTNAGATSNITYTLPPAVVGRMYRIRNATDAYTLTVTPNGSDRIGLAAAGVSTVLPARTILVLECRTAGRWEVTQWTPNLSATAAPTAGTWAVGQIVFNSAPTAGGNIGWVCVTAGSPGTWKAFGTIAS